MVGNSLTNPWEANVFIRQKKSPSDRKFQLQMNYHTMP